MQKPKGWAQGHEILGIGLLRSLWVIPGFSNCDCETQWRYLQTTILANANIEGGKGEGQLVTQKARFGAQNNCTTSQSEYISSEAW